MRLRAVAALVALLAAAACGAGAAGTSGADPGDRHEARPTVVVTMNILGDVVSETLGPHADVEVLLPVGADPHSYEPSAAQVARIESADVIVANGLGLEEAMWPVVEGAAGRDTPLVEIAPLLDPLEYGADVPGGLPGELDGHVWTDAARYARVPGIVADAVVEHVELDSVVVDHLRRRAETVAGDLEALDREVAEMVAAVPPERRTLVTNHHVLNYFAQRYDFDVVGAVIPSGSTLASPSAADLAELVAAIEAAQVPVLFADASAPDRLAEVLADEADLDVEVVSLWTESLGPPGSGASTYAEMMRTNAGTIARHLAA